MSEARNLIFAAAITAIVLLFFLIWKAIMKYAEPFSYEVTEYTVTSYMSYKKYDFSPENIVDIEKCPTFTTAKLSTKNRSLKYVTYLYYTIIEEDVHGHWYQLMRTTAFGTEYVMVKMGIEHKQVTI
jgi:hypothetical protein